VRVSLRASELAVFDGRTLIAVHPRVVASGGQSVDLDHYLEVLKTKPGHYLVPPPWPAPARRGRSRPRTRHSGQRPAERMALARRGHPDCHRAAHREQDVQRVVSLTQRRLMEPAAVIAGLPADTRAAPSVRAYDELLAKRPQPTPATLSRTASKENIS
jgi:hypothetical protein